MPSTPSLPHDFVRDEIGEQQWDYITNLVLNRLGTPLEDVCFRMAPSIIARSECELFSVSAPRFAIRLLLPDGGFLNLRRIPILARICQPLRWLSAPSNCRLPAEVIQENVSLKGCCIADSVLVPSPSIFPKNEWHILATPLGRAYGEFSARDPRDVVGTPFVRQILLGGGMCAQACCYMATALLHEHAAGIHGVAEVTAIASKKIIEGQAGELSLAGMDVQDMSRYFQDPHVKLRAPVLDLPLTLISDKRLDTGRLFAHYLQAVRAYILSGFPVIMTVDPSKLYRQKSKPVQPTTVDTDGKTVLHAVLAVGISLPGISRIVINDPSSRPFEIVEQCRLRPAVSIPNTRSFRKFLPVTPHDVRLPLLTPMSRSTNPFFGLDALLRFAFPVVSPGNDKEEKEVDYGEVDPGDQFRLFNIQGPFVEWSDVLCRGDSIDPEFFSLLDRWLATPDGKPLSWVWSRHRRHSERSPISESLILCDATRAISASLMADSARQTRGKNLVLCLFVKDRVGGDWRIEWTGRRNILPSIITSHTCAKASHVHKSLDRVDQRSLIKGLEWYSFMQTETDIARRRSFAQKHGIQYNSALEYMAGFAEAGGPALDQAADDMVESICRGTRPIVALATFVPTISLPQLSTSASKGRRALEFVAKVADRLAVRQDLQRKMVIEIVAGSRVQGLSADSSCAFRASFSSEEDCTTNLLDNLRSLVTEVNSQQVVWAIELEPGPLFTIRDWKSISRFCERVEQDNELCDHVGLNLDISHWRMSATPNSDSGLTRICPRLIRDSPSVFGRIVHSHISGHHERAHFGDIPIGVLNTPEEFAPWIDLLRERAACTQTLLPFSGYISFEFEAAKDELICAAAFQDFAMLLGRSNGATY